MKKTKRKLYLIGIDSAPLWILKELQKEFNLKGFEYFEHNGALVELKSTLPPVTAAAWPTIYTGLEPRKHEVMDFLCLDKDYTRQLIYYDESKIESFWDVLSSNGLKSLLITPAMILKKSSRSNVDTVTGWPLPPRFSSKELEAIAKRFGFRGESETGLRLDKGEISLKEASEEYVESIRSRAEFSKYLIKKNNYDLAFVCFTETDRIQHYTLNKEDWSKHVGPLYEQISNFIEWILYYSKKNDEDSLVLIVSDHGAQAVKEKFLVNVLLIENKFAKLKEDFSVKKETNTIGSKTQKMISEQVMKLPFRRYVYQKLPSQLKKHAEKFIDTGLSQAEIHEDDFDMKNTSAFASISYGPVGMIWLNDKRFSTPGVDENRKRKIKGEIVKLLEGVKSGKSSVVDKVFDGLDYYKGSSSFIPPDIMFLLKEGYVVDFSSYSDSIFTAPEVKRSGDHTLYGILGVAMPNKKIRIKIPKNLSVANISPTIIDYFELGDRKAGSILK